MNDFEITFYSDLVSVKFDAKRNGYEQSQYLLSVFIIDVYLVTSSWTEKKENMKKIFILVSDTNRIWFESDV